MSMKWRSNNGVYKNGTIVWSVFWCHDKLLQTKQNKILWPVGQDLDPSDMAPLLLFPQSIPLIAISPFIR